MGLAASEDKKTVWVWTKSKDVMTASVERGWDTFIFTPKTQPLCEEWKCKFIDFFILALLLLKRNIVLPKMKLKKDILTSS
jgi:hypothetical protein